MVEKYPSVTVIGDSLFKGVVYDEQKKRYVFSPNSCQHLLERDLKMQIDNHAKFGATIEKAKSILGDIIDHDPNQVIAIELGNNDADFDWEAISRDPEGTHESRTTLEHFREDLFEMVREIKARGKIPVLVTPPPIDAERYFRWLVQSGLNGDNILRWLGGIRRIYQYHECYSMEVMNCARLMKCPLLNIRQAFLESRDNSIYYCADGIHLNDDGHRVMADVIKENINKLEV